jgi:hypothetical protein
MYFSLMCDPYLGQSRFTFNQSTWIGHVFWNNYTIKTAEPPPQDVKPFTFVFNRGDFPPLNCTAKTVYVEVGVTCPTYTTCSASRVRRSRYEHPPTDRTRLGWFLGIGPGSPLSVNMSKPVGSDDYASQKNEPAIDLYSRSWIGTPKNYMATAPANASELSFEKLSIRLSQTLNAYWSTMYCKNSLVRRFNETTLPPDDKRIWSYQDESYQREPSRETYLFAGTWPSTGTKRNNVAVFQAHYGWVVALIVSSSVLIAASLIPFYVRNWLSHGPDVLMNVSSLAVRDNPYVALPATGTYLGASDRSRYLRSLRVKFGDVGREGGLGRLAIGRADGDVGLLRRGRKYM